MTVQAQSVLIPPSQGSDRSTLEPKGARSAVTVFLCQWQCSTADDGAATARAGTMSVHLSPLAKPFVPIARRMIFLQFEIQIPEELHGWKEGI